MEAWRGDTALEGFEAITLALADDFEGPVSATLVRLLSSRPSGRAVLYIHGYCDYFFQAHLADEFVERGWDFYALDLRKYGRSLQPHQSPNVCRDVREYFEEITEAIDLITAGSGAQSLVLMGHSTGGLTSSLYLHEGARRAAVSGLILNSPFLEFNLPVGAKQLIPLVALIGRRWPNVRLGGLSSAYGQSIHRSALGEWTYDLAWKPMKGFPNRAGWVRAIHRAHRKAQAGLSIQQPILLLRSARSVRSVSGRHRAGFTTADGVLDVGDMVRYGPRLGREVTVVPIEGALHDVMLSAPSIRARAVTDMFDWLAHIEQG